MNRTQMLKLVVLAGVLAAGAVGLYYTHGTAASHPSLTVDYGAQGIERIAYKGVVLEDLQQNPADAFHIWHIKMTRLDGQVLSTGQYGWGENNDGRSWDSAAHTWNYRFVWGTIAVHFAQAGDHLDIQVTEQNNANSGVILDGAAIYPFVLHLPQTPLGFTKDAPGRLAFNSDAPSITVADYGQGEVVAVVPDAAKPLYSGFLPATQPNAYTPIVSGTPLDTTASQAHDDRPVAPGETDTFTVSLRFGPSGADLASDIYANWTKSWPTVVHWPDRRIIGTIYLASSPRTGDPTHSAGASDNPRRYFTNDASADVDIRTPAGVERFQNRLLQQATDSVAVLHRLNAQGAITWDIEGEEYPQETSYLCAPDQIARIAPEMETPIHDAASPYAGMKLDDAYFKILHDAGFRVGVCVRPQRFELAADRTARQVNLPANEIAAELIRKMKYTHDRWGATLFYLDSTVQQNGAPLDAAILRQAAAALPDSLLIPEESTLKDYAYTAPFRSFLFHGDTGTPATVRRVYPAAFSVNLVNDVDASKLAAARDELTDAVRGGDILMAHAAYWQANNTALVQIYKDAAEHP